MKTLLHTLLYLIAFCLMPHLANAEDFNLKMQSTDGQQYALSEFIGKGKWTIVNVWSPQCPYCRHELPEVSEFHDKHHNKDAIVVGLTIHLPDYGLPNRKLVKDFADSYLVEFPLLLVDDKTVNQVIDRPFHGVPVFYVYNPKGEFVKRIDGMVALKDLEAAIKP